MLLPFSGMEFIKEGQYPRKSSLGITIGGIFGVFIAAFIVKSLPINILKVLVICVIFYTATTMLKAGLTKLKENRAGSMDLNVD